MTDSPIDRNFILSLLISKLNSFQDNEIVTVDLNDIYEGCTELINLINRILEGKINNQQEFYNVLSEIEVNLEHLSWHHNSIKEILKL